MPNYSQQMSSDTFWHQISSSWTIPLLLVQRSISPDLGLAPPSCQILMSPFGWKNGCPTYCQKIYTSKGCQSSFKKSLPYVCFKQLFIEYQLFILPCSCLPPGNTSGLNISQYIINHSSYKTHGQHSFPHGNSLPFIATMSRFCEIFFAHLQACAHPKLFTLRRPYNKGNLSFVILAIARNLS